MLTFLLTFFRFLSNGVLGLMNNLARDPNRLVFKAFGWVVLPAWLGTAVGLTRSYTANEFVFFIPADESRRVSDIPKHLAHPLKNPPKTLN